MANGNTQGPFRGPKNRLACREAFYEALSRLSCGKGQKEEYEEARRRRAQVSLNQAEVAVLD